MKAVGLTKYLPITDEESLVDLEIEMPQATGHDLLVKVEALSVNPVDTKVRAPKPQDIVENKPKVLGYDAVGTVVSTGEHVTLFTPGDKVFYAGDITRQGSNSEFQLIDERIVGHAPKTLTNSEAAAVPLTLLTAWEAMFERMGISINGESEHTGSILILGGAGGVASMAIQLVAKLTSLTVIASASRDESKAWCEKLGADYVVNHHADLEEELAATGHKEVDYILCCNNTDMHFQSMVNIIKPLGRICSIVDNVEPLPLQLLKPKSASFCWEFMFTRAKFQTPDMIEQHHILNEAARLLDEGILQTSVQKVLSPINANNLREAHRIIEEGKMIGKLVLESW